MPDVELARGIRVTHYRRMVERRDRPGIAALIRERLVARYLDPVDAQGAPRSGFAMMAVTCLMIEALESFRQGWPDTGRRSREAFRRFFDRSGRFPEVRAHVAVFYEHIRCGILHQAESTGGWRVLRTGSMFDAVAKTVNAAKFIKALRRELNDYSSALANSEWEDLIARHARTKLDAICRNAD